MGKITISKDHPEAGRIYAEAYEAALKREAALREELASQKNHYKVQLQGAKEADALQQRLTVAEKRLSQVDSACDLAISAIDDDERGANFVKIIQAIKDKAALKPAEADPIQKFIDENPLAKNEAAQALLNRPKRWSESDGEGDGS